MSEILLSAAAKRGVTVPPPPHDTAALGALAAAIFLQPMRGGRRMPREEAYLAAARSGRVTTSVGDLATWEWGEPGAPLVGLVHGWEGHAGQLGAFAGPLAAAGFRVLAFDAPGHGDSPGHEAHVPLLARLLPEIEARAGRFFGFVGHSMGAAAAAFSIDRGTSPRALVLLAPPMSMRERVGRVSARLALAPEVHAAFVAAVERRTGVSFADVDMDTLADRAPCALLVCHDPADTDTSFAESERIVARWRGACLEPCPGRGHYRILATPEVVRQAVDFLVAQRAGAV
jgi:pimeloyl-ACP methyl ester carboxylesterase